MSVMTHQRLEVLRGSAPAVAVFLVAPGEERLAPRGVVRDHVVGATGFFWSVEGHLRKAAEVIDPEVRRLYRSAEFGGHGATFGAAEIVFALAGGSRYIMHVQTPSPGVRRERRPAVSFYPGNPTLRT
jgi:hypothetical protein